VAALERDSGAGVDRTELKQRLKQLLVEGLRLDEIVPADIRDGEAIFGEGLGLDSIDALELVVLVEERFNITIPDEDVGKKAFSSVAALADFIVEAQAA
jgi:acyl carrier protein